MFEVIFAGQISKDPNYSESIEDAILFGINRTVIAIGDGASESFDSKTWSDLLVKKFVEDSSIDEDWLNAAHVEYKKNYDISTLSWSKQSSFERGSFAAILGIKKLKTDLMQVTAIGDCEIFIVDAQEKIKFCYPYFFSSEFSNQPKILSTKSELNSHINELNSITVNINQSDLIIMMSDALACWFMQSIEFGNNDWKQILDITTQEQLKIFVEHKRENKVLKTDDVTLVVAQSVEDFTYELSNT